MTEETKAYRKEWQKKHRERVRMQKLNWYYRNREKLLMANRSPYQNDLKELDKYFMEV